MSLKSYFFFVFGVSVKCWSAETMSVSEQVGFNIFAVVFALWGQVALVRIHE